MQLAAASGINSASQNNCKELAVATGNNIELSAYIAAIDGVLKERTNLILQGERETELVAAMHSSNRHFLDCVDAVITFRNKGIF